MFNLFDFTLSDGISQLLSQMVEGLPRFIFAFLVLIIGLIIAKIIKRMLVVAFDKLNVDKLGEKLNEIEFIHNSNFRIELGKIISTFIYYFLLLFVLIISTDILDLEPVSNLVVGIFNFVPKLFVAIIILILGTLLADALKNVVYTTCNSIGIPSAKMISNFMFYFLMINIFVSAIAQADINTEFLSTNISILIAGLVFAFAIGYGLASRKTMANYLATFYIKDRLNIGDRVTLSGYSGLIVDIDKAAVVIDTGSSRVVVPLNNVSNESIEIHN